MAREVTQSQIYVDSEYIRSDLKKFGIAPWFGPTELKRPIGNIHIDGKTLTVRRVIFYDAIDYAADTAEEHQSYLERLGRLEDTLVRLGTVTGVRNKRQKGVDMRMGRDMVTAARSGFIEYVILASGDADFIPIVEEIQDLGPKVLVLGFSGSMSSDLVLAADRTIELPSNSDRIWAIH